MSVSEGVKQCYISHRARVQWVTTKKEPISSKFWYGLFQGYCLLFLNSNNINYCTPRCTVDKRYGNLAASIGSTTMKSYTSTTLIAFNSLKGSIFLECFRLPVLLTAGRLWIIIRVAARGWIYLSDKLECQQRGVEFERFLSCPGDLLTKALS